MRLDKFLCDMDCGTRSEVKKLIRSGRVLVNGSIVKDAGQAIEEHQDEVTVDGKAVQYESEYYILLHKPAGYVCSANEKGQKSVLELIDEPFAHRLHMVGRLDKDTEGLLLCTTDGKLSHNLLAPGKHVAKLYYAKLAHAVTNEDIEAFATGLSIGDDKPTLPAKLTIGATKEEAYIEIVEGRYHQIKRMFEARNNTVCYLKRLQMKNLTLGELKIGEYRRLTKEELLDLSGT